MSAKTKVKELRSGPVTNGEFYGALEELHIDEDDWRAETFGVEAIIYDALRYRKYSDAALAEEFERGRAYEAKLHPVEFEAENQRLNGELADCEFPRGLAVDRDSAIQQRDALRAEVDKYKTAYENEESNKRLAQDASAAWSEDCEKLRAEVETLRRENGRLAELVKDHRKGYEAANSSYIATLKASEKDKCDAQRERDEARAELEKTKDLLEKFLQVGLPAERERDAALATLAKVRQACEGALRERTTTDMSRGWDSACKSILAILDDMSPKAKKPRRGARKMREGQAKWRKKPR